MPSKQATLSSFKEKQGAESRPRSPSTFLKRAGRTAEDASFARRYGLELKDYIQPRRIAATSIAKRVATERRCVVGEEVGYSVHFDYNFNRNGKLSQIKYTTDKELLREMTRNPLVLLLRVYDV